MSEKKATYALAVLTFINIFNYIDRWVVAAVLEAVRIDLGLSDTQLGVIGSGFVVVYALTSPFFGTFGDRGRRPPLIAFGVALWSVATALAGFARGFWSLFIARSTVGVGEGAYGTIAPAMLADHFPIERRGRAMAVFYMAIPVGSAAGYILGGFADHHFGWRAAFWIAGVPGILLSLLVLFVHDPPRGINDAQEQPAPDAKRVPWYTAYRQLFSNQPYILTVFGYAAYTFALGGLAFWMPAFLERVRGVPRQSATTTFGIIALCTGFVGTFAGGWLGDYFLKKSRQSYLWVSGIATLIAAPITLVALTHPDKPVYLTAIVIAELLIFISTGPVNTAIVNAVPASGRATAVGLSVLIMHGLGDIPSPPLIGVLSDAASLEKAFLVIPVAIVIAAAIWLYAAWQGERATA
jgi:MFS family permease